MHKKKEVVVLTGASAGIGRATAERFGSRSGRIALLARGHAGLEGAAREIEQLGGEALVIPTDVANSRQVAAAAEKVEQTWGDIDIWVNCATATILGPVYQGASEAVLRRSCARTGSYPRHNRY
jgi:NADP-dependent 3-hydroxy acid dehydrogenase YdfG